MKATTNRYTFTLDGKNNIAKLEKHGDASPAYNATITTAHGNTSANNLTLFSAVTTNKAKARIYSAQVYRDGVLQRDFIPVLYKKTTPAMFDRQNKELYLNAGTGTFNYKKVNNTNW